MQGASEYFEYRSGSEHDSNRRFSSAAEFIFLSPIRRWISKPRARPGPYEMDLVRDASAAFERVAVLHENRVGNAAADRDRVDRSVFGEAAQDGELRDECIPVG